MALTDITRIYLSHLHDDHAGGLRLFDRSIPVWVQRRELEYGLADHPFPERHGMFRIDYDDPEIDWRLLDGDAEIAPGIRAVLTPGHTPGHQSFVVDLPDGGGSAGGDLESRDLEGGDSVGGYVFAFDAGDLTENFERELAVGGFVHCEAEDTIAPIRKLNAIAAETGYRLIPGHDPRSGRRCSRSLLLRSSRLCGARSRSPKLAKQPARVRTARHSRKKSCASAMSSAAASRASSTLASATDIAA